MVIPDLERHLVGLDDPVPPVEPLTTERAASAVSELRRLLGDAGAVSDERRRLRGLLTARPPGSLPGEAWPLLDRLWATEAAPRPVTRPQDLPRLAEEGWGARVSLWRGDITSLAVDAIVNAANAELTGCYQPFHACVDNAIHTAAGPRLREDCGRLMEARGRPEPDGTATATRGWFLPARYVVHTVGPMVPDHRPQGRDVMALARCYTSCLDAAADLRGAGSVAFCSISTGVFGYPVTDAAPLALRTVRAWLERCHALDHVVMVTYSSTDEAVYAAAAREVLDGG